MKQLVQEVDETMEAIGEKEGKYLTFSLAGEEYGIGILTVKEIIGMMPITSVPQTPEFVKGLINLRGRVIPVMYLRLRFGMEPLAYSDRTCIIVAEIGRNAQAMLMGVVVDSVSEVLNIKGDRIEETPNFGTRLSTEYILGIARIEEQIKILLDIDRILTTEETVWMQGVNNEGMSSGRDHKR